MLRDFREQLLRYCGCVQGEVAYVGPRRAEIYLTHKCNLDCIACWSFSPLLKANKLAPEELSWERTETLLRDLAASGCKEILFVGGGEPMMYPRIMEAIEIVKSLGMSCFITTNLTLINSKRARRMVQLGVDRLYASIWAATPQTYSQTHPNANERTFESIRRRLHEFKVLKKEHSVNKPEIIIHNVVFSMNCYETRAMVDFADQMGACSIQFTALYAIPGATDALLLDENMKSEVLRQLDSIPRALQERNGLHGPGSFLHELDVFRGRLEAQAASKGNYDVSALANLPCQIGWFYTIIRANGDVIPCCKGQDIPMGNIYENAFEDIWFSDTYRTFRRMSKSQPKTDPYFRPMKCLKMCDNIGMLQKIENKMARLRSLEPFTKRFLIPFLKPGTSKSAKTDLSP